MRIARIYRPTDSHAGAWLVLEPGGLLGECLSGGDAIASVGFGPIEGFVGGTYCVVDFYLLAGYGGSADAHGYGNPLFP
jgi:hypothetical protein